MVETSVSRRGFLKARLRPAQAGPRPPWAVAPGRFEDTCTRCGDCALVCPTGIIRSGDGGFPLVDFSFGECTFCARCVEACEPGALSRADAGGAARLPWSLKVRIAEHCLAHRGVECRVCGECCKTSAIRFRPRLGGVALPEPVMERCTGCGACLAPCPVGAIAMEMQQ